MRTKSRQKTIHLAAKSCQYVMGGARTLLGAGTLMQLIVYYIFVVHHDGGTVTLCGGHMQLIVYYIFIVHHDGGTFTLCGGHMQLIVYYSALDARIHYND